MSLFGHKQKTVEPDVIPTTVEQAIPIRDVCEDGIFLVGRNLWSKTYRFTDVNYATASKEDKEGMFFAYSEILNTFDAGAMTKITVNNRRLNQTKFRENNMLELQGDSLDKYRNEYNRILAGNANLSNGITQDKYLTVTVEKKTEEEARAYFNRISAEFAALFAKLGSKFEEVTAEEKLRILFDFFHYGAEDDYHYDAGLHAQRGYSFKDAIAPDCLEFRTDYFKMDGRYGRVLYLRDYANFIKDSFIAELTDIDRGIFIDEIYLLFKHEYSANFLFTLWKRVRKYGAFITGITQNVEDLLQSHTARTMLANSELVVMLNQAATDREELASLMGISDLQMGYITNVDAGHGLVKIGGALVPFVNKVPKDTKLYALMTTKFGES